MSVISKWKTSVTLFLLHVKYIKFFSGSSPVNEHRRDFKGFVFLLSMLKFQKRNEKRQLLKKEGKKKKKKTHTWDENVLTPEDKIQTSFWSFF